MTGTCQIHAPTHTSYCFKYPITHCNENSIIIQMFIMTSVNKYDKQYVLYTMIIKLHTQMTSL